MPFINVCPIVLVLLKMSIALLKIDLTFIAMSSRLHKPILMSNYIFKC